MSRSIGRAWCVLFVATGELTWSYYSVGYFTRFPDEMQSCTVRCPSPTERTHPAEFSLPSDCTIRNDQTARQRDPRRLD